MASLMGKRCKTVFVWKTLFFHTKTLFMRVKNCFSDRYTLRKNKVFSDKQRFSLKFHQELNSTLLYEDKMGPFGLMVHLVDDVF